MCGNYFAWTQSAAEIYQKCWLELYCRLCRSDKVLQQQERPAIRHGLIDVDPRHLLQRGKIVFYWQWGLLLARWLLWTYRQSRCWFRDGCPWRFNQALVVRGDWEGAIPWQVSLRTIRICWKVRTIWTRCLGLRWYWCWSYKAVSSGVAELCSSLCAAWHSGPSATKLNRIGLQHTRVEMIWKASLLVTTIKTGSRSGTIHLFIWVPRC